jgi:hypothetical protein
MKTLVSLNTALLAKDCGYKKPTIHYFAQLLDGSYETRVAFVRHTKQNYYNIRNYISTHYEHAHRPTLAQLQKWIRDEYDGHIWIIPSYQVFYKYKDKTENKLGFKTYEEALDYGLYEILKQIKYEDSKK